MIHHMSQEQKVWVRKTGFGQILDFKLEMLPGPIAYNVMQIFQKESVSLELRNGRINIFDEDVFDVFGFPCGGETVTIGPIASYKEKTNQWLSQFKDEKDKDNITTVKVVEMMRGEQAVTDNFKLNFLIVLSNVLMGTSPGSYVDRKLIRFDDIDNCYRYNWCEYVKDFLVYAISVWNRTLSNFFCGPLIFLTVSFIYFCF